jgi:HPt (histidine-containing phosphotransfer) domain-containing protein
MDAAQDAIDWKVLRLLAAQLDDDVVTSILDAYSEQLPMRAATMRASVPVGGTTLRDAAHALTASSLTIGAERLGHLCRDIESTLALGDDDRARALATKALDEIDNVTVALQRSPWHRADR